VWARQLCSLGGGGVGSRRCSCLGDCAVPPTPVSPIAGVVEGGRGEEGRPHGLQVHDDPQG
jgi:hypothetical protein